jgi:hypothetical protein
MQYKKTAVIKYVPLINCHENYRYSENYLKLPGQNIDCFNINLLKTKRRPLNLKTQSVPRCKHFTSRV